MKPLLPVGLSGAVILMMTAACGPRGESRTGGGEATPPAVVNAAKDADAGVTLPVLRAAPAWTLKDVDGRDVKSTDFKGKVVLVDFWATWCGPCRKEMPEYEALRKKYAERGLMILGLSLDDGVEPGELKRFGETMKVGYPLILADAEVAESFGDFKGFLPTAYLIDREGKIRHVKTGLTDMAVYEKLIVSLL